MIALGCLASISPTGIVEGTISEYTWHSRTRRAMSWAYCAPKSTTRTVSNPPCPDNGYRLSPGSFPSLCGLACRWLARDGFHAQPGDAAAVQLGDRDRVAGDFDRIPL